MMEECKLTLDAKLQTGAFGTVWEATWNGTKVAAKVQSKNTHMLTHEDAVMKALGPHPNILRSYGKVCGKSTTSLLVELCDEDLLDVIRRTRRIPQADAMAIFRQICVGVAHMHRTGIHHCDIKPENVLLLNRVVKLADFGASAVGDVFTTRNLGSAQYLCPEVLKWHDGCKANLAASDVWSLGVLLFTMLAGYQPWSQPTVSDIHFSRFLGGDFRFPTCVSAEAGEFIMSLLSLDPSRRPSLAAILEHDLLAVRTTGATAGSPPPSGAFDSPVVDVPTTVKANAGLPAPESSPVKYTPVKQRWSVDCDMELDDSDDEDYVVRPSPRAARALKL